MEDVMRRMVKVIQRIEDCRWSQPACWRNPFDDEEIESGWTCERTGIAIPVTQADCDECPHWSDDQRRMVERDVVSLPRRLTDFGCRKIGNSASRATQIP